MGTLATLVGGALFGLALAAPPGPMNAVIAEESVARGWTAGVRAGLGAMTADLLSVTGAWFGVVGFVRRYPVVRGVLVAVGGLLMLYFGFDAVRDLRTGFPTGASGPSRAGASGRRSRSLRRTPTRSSSGSPSASDCSPRAPGTSSRSSPTGSRGSS